MKVQKKDRFGGNICYIKAQQHAKGHKNFGWNASEAVKFVKVVFDKKSISYQKEARQIVCTMDCHLDFNIPSEWYNKLTYQYHNEFTVVGVAKCSPEDEFDYDKGRLIAQTEAENEAYTVGKNMIAQLQLELASFLEALGGQYYFLAKYIDHNNQFLNNLVTGQYIPKKKKQ